MIALLSWPLVVVILFANLRAPIAFLAAVIGGYLLLPTRTSIDLPMLPALNKDSIPIFSAMTVWSLRRGWDRKSPGESLPSWFPRGLVLWLILLGGAGAFATAATNSEVLRYGPTVLPGIRLYDALSMILSFMLMILPLIAGRRILAAPQGNRDMLVVLCAAGVAYSFPALFEIRMSPQLNNWIYGFFPHSFLQHYRYGGWRPIVFLSHGLWLSVFFGATVLAALACFRGTTGPKRTRFLLAAIWLFGTLYMAKSLGALMVTTVFAAVILVFSVKLQLTVAAAVASIIMVYPVARSADIVPIGSVLSVAESINPARAGSLQYRLDQEDILLAKAKERPLFGWGGWSRSRVFDDTGRDVSVTDGAWVILFGVGGWTRYISVYGLLGLPILLLFLRKRRYTFSREVAGLAVILTANLVDTIPNGTLTPITWLLAGTLWGRLEWERSQVPEKSPEVTRLHGESSRVRPIAGEVHGPANGPVYTRQNARVERTTRSVH